jgi:hypothetical protein
MTQSGRSNGPGSCLIEDHFGTYNKKVPGEGDAPPEALRQRKKKKEDSLPSIFTQNI